MDIVYFKSPINYPPFKQCDCGRLYNSSGQELAPREQWEESYEEDY
jgi:hypothetical protein